MHLHGSAVIAACHSGCCALPMLVLGVLLTPTRVSCSCSSSCHQSSHSITARAVGGVLLTLSCVRLLQV
jgi:hypothetical protein